MIRITTVASGSSLKTVLTTASPLRGGAGIYACGRSHKISGFRWDETAGLSGTSYDAVRNALEVQRRPANEEE
jgi:hypothetical protein